MMKLRLVGLVALVVMLLVLVCLPVMGQDTNSNPPSFEATEAVGTTVVDVPAGGNTTVTVNPSGAVTPAVTVPDTSLIPGLTDSTLLTFAIIALVIAHMVTQGKSTALLAKYVDPELAMKITGIQQDSFKMGLEAGLNASRLTPGLEDDQSWIARARANGYEVKEVNGRYTLEKLGAPVPNL